MQKKNLQNFGLILLISCFVLMKFVSADSELYIGCGGDNQTTIGCWGDNQTFSTATEFVAANISAPTGNGTTIINVTNITIIQGGPGGGGGTTYVPTNPVATFSLNTTNLKAFLKQGQIVTQSVIVTNNAGQAATISISSDLGNLVRLSTTILSLNPGESKTISIDFIASDNVDPDLYLGSIIFSSGGASLPVFAALEIESKNPLLDVAINLPDKEVSPGSTMLAGITLYNLGSTFGDVVLTYIIKSDDGQVLLTETNTVAIQTQTSFIKNLQIPDNAPLGHYILYVRADYIGKIASASTGFDIVNISPKEKIYIITIVGLIILIAGFISFMILRRVKKRFKQIKRIGLEDLLWK